MLEERTQHIIEMDTKTKMREDPLFAIRWSLVCFGFTPFTTLRVLHITAVIHFHQNVSIFGFPSKSLNTESDCLLPYESAVSYNGTRLSTMSSINNQKECWLLEVGLEPLTVRKSFLHTITEDIVSVLCMCAFTTPANKVWEVRVFLSVTNLFFNVIIMKLYTSCDM